MSKYGATSSPSPSPSLGRVMVDNMVSYTNSVLSILAGFYLLYRVSHAPDWAWWQYNLITALAIWLWFVGFWTMWHGIRSHRA